MSEQSKLPSWFKTFAIVSLIWNLLGVMAFVARITMSAETIALMPPAEQNLYANTPLWATIAFGCAVFGGSLGCVALLMKKSMAVLLFTVSLVGLGIQMFHAFFIIPSFDVYGLGGLVMPIMVAAWAVALLLIAKKSQANQWIS